MSMEVRMEKFLTTTELWRKYLQKEDGVILMTKATRLKVTMDIRLMSLNPTGIEMKEWK